MKLHDFVNKMSSRLLTKMCINKQITKLQALYLAVCCRCKHNHASEKKPCMYVLSVSTTILLGENVWKVWNRLYLFNSIVCFFHMPLV